jgi:hypothetical protein
MIADLDYIFDSTHLQWSKKWKLSEEYTIYLANNTIITSSPNNGGMR